MSTGDVSAAVNADGWSITARVEGLGSGGVYDFGIAAGGDPTGAKIVLTVTSQGYSETVLGTVVRTTYGNPDRNLGARRLPYPNATTPNETVVGSDVDIVIALYDHIYNDDTLTISFASGWYTQGGTPSNAVTDLAVTNNSTLDYPRAIANWAYPGYTLKTGNFPVEVEAKDKFGIACVEIIATDGVTTLNYFVTSETISTHPDVKSVAVYAQTINVSTLVDGIITVNFKAYPNVGDAASVRDSSDAVNTWPTPLYTSQKYRLDRSTLHGFACVRAAGNDGTGTVYNSQSGAEAGNAYLTIAAAVTAVQAYHNTNASHNDAGGGTVLLEEGTWTLNSSAGGVQTEWVTITKLSTGTKANTILQPAAANALHPPMTRFYDITLSGAGYFRCTNVRIFWVDSCAVALTGTISFWQFKFGASTHNTGSFGNREYVQYSVNDCSWAIIRGNDHSVMHEATGYVILGNHNVNCQQRATVDMPIQNNILYGYNYCDDATTIDVQLELAIAADDLTDIAIFNNVLPRYGSQTAPLVQISADGTTTSTNNILIHYNSFIGSRCNFAYNDNETGGPYLHTNWSVIGNNFSNYNVKDDTFGNNPDATGGWSVGYGVGHKYNFYRTFAADEWAGESSGLYYKAGTAAVPLEPLYVDDNSADGAGTSGGDYHLQETSEAVGLSLLAFEPYDLDGVARTEPGAAGAYEYPVPSGENYFIIPSFIRAIARLIARTIGIAYDDPKEFE